MMYSKAAVISVGLVFLICSVSSVPFSINHEEKHSIKARGTSSEDPICINQVTSSLPAANSLSIATERKALTILSHLKSPINVEFESCQGTVSFFCCGSKYY